MTARLMVFKPEMAAAKTWRRLKGQNHLPKVVQGVMFHNGVEVTSTPAWNAACSRRHPGCSMVWSMEGNMPGLFRGLITWAVAMAGLSQAMAQPTPLRIGVLTDMSGQFADFSGPGSVAAAGMAVEDFGGSVLGRKIEILQGDHQNKPDVGAGVAREWFDQRGVSAIADLTGSTIGLAVMQIIRDKDKIAILSGAGSDDLLGKQCAPGGFVWSFNAYTQSKVVGTGLMKQGYDTWFLISQDSTFGLDMERNLGQLAAANGARIFGTSRLPIVNQDFSASLLMAQASGAKMIGLTGGDVSTFVKQANEFGVVAAGQHLAAMTVFIQWIHSLTPQQRGGLFSSTSFYWDRTEQSRAWSARFFSKVGTMPSMTHAATYSGVLHYLKAVAKAGTTENAKVIAAMHELPVEDATANGVIRQDGLLQRDYYLYESKSPAESKGEWDLLKLVQTESAADSAPPPNPACPSNRSATP